LIHFYKRSIDEQRRINERFGSAVKTTVMMLAIPCMTKTGN